MDVLITGGNGRLGRHLVAALQDRGDSVRVLALPEEDTRWLRQRGVAVHRGDVRWPDTLAAPMSGVAAVLHLAGLMGAWRPFQDYRAVNVTGTKPGSTDAFSGLSVFKQVSALIGAVDDCTW